MPFTLEFLEHNEENKKKRILKDACDFIQFFFEGEVAETKEFEKELEKEVEEEEEKEEEGKNNDGEKGSGKEKEKKKKEELEKEVEEEEEEKEEEGKNNDEEKGSGKEKEKKSNRERNEEKQKEVDLNVNINFDNEGNSEDEKENQLYADFDTNNSHFAYNITPYFHNKHMNIIKQICRRNNLKYYHYFVNHYEEIKNIKGVKLKGEGKICFLILCLNFILCNLNNENITIQELKYQIKQNITKDKVYCKHLAKIIMKICMQLKIRELLSIDLLPFIEKYVSNVINKIKQWGINKKTEENINSIKVKERTNIFDDIFNFINSNDTAPNKQLFRDSMSLDFLLESQEENQNQMSDAENGEDVENTENTENDKDILSVNNNNNNEKGTNNVNDSLTRKHEKNDKENKTEEVAKDEANKKEAKRERGYNNEKKDFLCKNKKRKTYEWGDNDKNEDGVVFKWKEFSDSHNITESEGSHMYNLFGTGDEEFLMWEQENENGNFEKEKKILVNKKERERKKIKKRKKEMEMTLEYLERNKVLLSLYACILYYIGIISNHACYMDLNVFDFQSRCNGENLYFLICCVVIITFSLFNVKTITDKTICNCFNVKQKIIIPKKNNICKFFISTLNQFLGINYIKETKTAYVYMRVIFTNYILLQMYILFIFRKYEVTKKNNGAFLFRQLHIHVFNVFTHIKKRFLNCLDIIVDPHLLFQSRSLYKGIQNIIMEKEEEEEKEGNGIGNYLDLKKKLKKLLQQHLSEEDRKKFDERNFDEQYDIDLKRCDTDLCYLSEINNSIDVSHLYYLISETSETKSDKEKKNGNTSNGFHPKDDNKLYLSKRNGNKSTSENEKWHNEMTYMFRFSTADAEQNGMMHKKEKCPFLEQFKAILQKINVYSINDTNTEITRHFAVSELVQFIFYVVLKSVIYNCYSLSYFDIYHLHEYINGRYQKGSVQEEREEQKKGETGTELDATEKWNIQKKIKQWRIHRHKAKKFFLCEQIYYLKHFLNFEWSEENILQFLKKEQIILKSATDIDEEEEEEKKKEKQKKEYTHMKTKKNHSSDLFHKNRTGPERNQGHEEPYEENGFLTTRKYAKKKKLIKAILCHTDLAPEDGDRKQQKTSCTFFDNIFNMQMIKVYKDLEKCFYKKELRDYVLSTLNFNYCSKKPLDKETKGRTTRKTIKFIKMNNCLYHTYYLIGVKAIRSVGYVFSFKNELNDYYSKVFRTKMSSVLSLEEIRFLCNKLYFYLLLYIKKFCCLVNNDNVTIQGELQTNTTEERTRTNVCLCKKKNCCYKIKTLVFLQNI